MGYALFAYRLGFAVCGRQERAAPAAGAKRKGHLRFPFLFGLLPFPCLSVWRRPETGDRFEKGTAEDFFFRVFRNLFAVSDNVLLHMWFHLRRARHKVNCPKGKRRSPGG